MPFIPVIDTARLELIYVAGLNICQNVLHVKNATFWTDATLETLCMVAASWWGSEMVPEVSDDVVLSVVRATNLGEAESYQFEYAPTSSNQGTRASPIMPLSVTVAIKFGTGLTGRSRRGRAYHVGLCEDQVEGNAIVSARNTAIVAAWNEFPVVLAGESPFWQHVVVSYISNGVPREEGLATPIQSYSSDGLVDTQRRRLT